MSSPRAARRLPCRWTRAATLRGHWLGLICSLLLVAVGGCASEDLVVTREPVHLRLVAAEAVGPLAEKLAVAYQEPRPWVSIDVSVLNSSRAEALLLKGEVDIALLSWIGEQGADSELWATPWARDGIGVVLHPSTKLPGSSLGHLQELFRGRLQEWEGQVFTVVSREDGSGTRNAFESMVMDYHPVTLNAAVVSSSEATIDMVARTPGAIGYVSSLRLGRDGPGDVVVLAVDDVPMDVGTISDGSYVLWRQLYVATVGEPAGELRTFAQWLLGPEGQTVTNLYAAEHEPGG